MCICISKVATPFKLNLNIRFLNVFTALRFNFYNFPWFCSIKVSYKKLQCNAENACGNRMCKCNFTASFTFKSTFKLIKWPISFFICKKDDTLKPQKKVFVSAFQEQQWVLFILSPMSFSYSKSFVCFLNSCYLFSALISICKIKSQKD